MRYVSFYDDRGQVRPGELLGENLRAIDAPSMAAFIAMKPGERDACDRGHAIPLASVRLAAAVTPPRNVICVGRNYLEHAREGARAAGRELKLPDVQRSSPS